MRQPLTAAVLNEPVTLHLRRDFVSLRAGPVRWPGPSAVLRQGQAPRVASFTFYGRRQRRPPARRRANAGASSSARWRRQSSRSWPGSVIAIPHTATVLEACEFFTLHRLLGVSRSRRR